MTTGTMHTPLLSSLLRLLLAGSAAATLLAGCAMQPNGRGGVLIGMDSAELFGTTLGTFDLPGGQQGVLRHDKTSNQFSVKLGGTFRVAPLPNIVSARIARVADIGQRTVVVIETQERNCAYKYVVMAIQGTDILQWSVGNCQDRPRAELAENGQALYLDFPAAGRLQRYLYTDQRMLNASVQLPPGSRPFMRPFADEQLHAVGDVPQPLPVPGSGAPLLPPATGMRTTASARVIPLPPQKAAGSAAAPAVPQSRTSQATVAARARPAAAALPQSMTIEAEEIKPKHIDLRK